MIYFSLIIFVVLSLYAMNLSGDIFIFVDPPVLLSVLLISTFFMVASTSQEMVKKAFFTLIKNDISQEQRVYVGSKRVFHVLGMSGILVGVFMTIIAWIAMAAHLDSLTTLGSALSLASLPLLYGLALKICCYVAEQKIETLSEKQALSERFAP